MTRYLNDILPLNQLVFVLGINLLFLIFNLSQTNFNLFLFKLNQVVENHTLFATSYNLWKTVRGLIIFNTNKGGHYMPLNGATSETN